MKGLFLDNFYKTISNMRLFLFLILIVVTALLVTGNDTVLEMFVYVSITGLSANAVVSIRKDAEAKWSRYEIALPVTRNEIVKCKYISYLFWLLIGTAVAVLVTGLTVLIHGNVFFVYGSRDVVSLFSLGIGIAVISGSLFIPSAYLFGADKSETLLIVSVIAGFGITVCLIWLINRGEILNYYLRLGLFNLAYVCLFIISYQLARRIYRKKEL